MQSTVSNAIIDPIPRHVLVGSSLVSFIGVCFGLFVGAMGSGLTAYESVSLPLLAFASAAAFIILLLTADRFLQIIGRVMVALWGAYLITNIYNQLFVESIYVTGSLVFGFWLPCYYVLTFVVVEERFAQKISWATVAATTALFTFKLYFAAPAFQDDIGIVLAVILLMMQPTIVLLLNALLGYRVKLQLAALEAEKAKQAYSSIQQSLTNSELAQVQLKNARDLLTNTIDSISSGIAVFDEQGALILANKSLVLASESVGLHLQIGKLDWQDYMSELKSLKSPSKNGGENENWADVLEKQHKNGGGYCELYLPDGRLFTIYEKQWDDGKFLVNFSDVSQLEKSKETISQLQKMEALGRLTGGIAHDFNNLLFIVLGNLEIIKSRISGSEDMSNLIENAISQTNKGATLIQHLLAFAKGGEVKTRDVNPAVLLRDLDPMLRSALTERIRLDYKIEEYEKIIEVESYLLETMILNIALNAKDAMPDGGLFTVKLSVEQYPNQNLSGEYIAFSFADSGQGIAEENIHKVFDPFFTTKEVGQGSGLGLSMVYGLAKQFKGDIKISSVLGKGTTIKLLIPTRVSEALVEQSEDSVKQLKNFGGKALLVEDNDDLRDVSKLRLEMLGFDVDTSASIGSAKSEFEAGKYQLLLCDVILPDGNGYDLAHEFKEKDESLAVLLNSGYTDLRIDDAEATTQVIQFPFIQKPHSIGELSEKLQKVLHG